MVITKSVLAASLLSSALMADAPCVALRITNGHGHAIGVVSGPANVTAEVRVQKRAEHRYIVVAWEYADPDVVRDETDWQPLDAMDGSIGSEERQLHGVSQSIRNDFKMRLEGGTFIVTATIYTDEARKHACGRATARVVAH